MTQPTCRHYEKCSAPICPFDNQSLENGIWYPDEECCYLATVPSWVKRQRRIAKKLSFNVEAGFFTCEMLKRKTRISSGLKGLDPEKDMEPQQQNWLDSHMGSKPMSEERKRQARMQIEMARSSIRKEENNALNQ